MLLAAKCERRPKVNIGGSAVIVDVTSRDLFSSLSLTGRRIDRQSFVRLAAGGAVASVVLAACGGTAAPAASSASPSAAPSSAAPKPSVAASAPASAPASAAACGERRGSASAKPSAAASASGSAAAQAGGGLPSYIPLAAKPKPDYVSKGELYEDGYIAYPKNAPKSVTQTPGLGSTVTLFDDGLYPLATPVDQNPAWQAINKALGATIQFNKVPPADYNAKMAAIMAGGDLPDLVSLFGGLGAAPNLPQFLQQAAADLTPFLGGDKVKDYPNLADIPTFAWKNSARVLSGKLYMIPSSGRSAAEHAAPEHRTSGTRRWRGFTPRTPTTSSAC